MSNDELFGKLVWRVARMRRLQRVVFRSIHDAKLSELLTLESQVDALLADYCEQQLPPLPELPELPELPAFELPELPPIPHTKPGSKP